MAIAEVRVTMKKCNIEYSIVKVRVYMEQNIPRPIVKSKRRAL